MPDGKRPEGKRLDDIAGIAAGTGRRARGAAGDLASALRGRGRRARSRDARSAIVTGETQGYVSAGLVRADGSAWRDERSGRGAERLRSHLDEHRLPYALAGGALVAAGLGLLAAATLGGRRRSRGGRARIVTREDATRRPAARVLAAGDEGSAPSARVISPDDEARRPHARIVTPDDATREPGPRGLLDGDGRPLDGAG